jgi:L-ascorbate metabolism protein UlaG (beta-lactamase superfamily)
MKEIIFCSILLMGCVLIHSAFGADAKGFSPEEMTEKIHWLGQAAVKIEAGDKNIFIDPYQIQNKDEADIILITHSHKDHFSKDDIAKVAKADTLFIAPKDCAGSIEETFKTKVMVSEPGMKTSAGDILIEAVPAYNVVKTKFHPKENNWVGYVLTVNGVRIYHAGDTEKIPEMKTFACDIAMLPLGQTYTMNSVEEAAEAAADVKAKIAIPIHYGLYEGTAEDAKAFEELLKEKMKVMLKAKE